MTYYEDDAVTLHHGDTLEVLRTLGAGSVDCCVTSPPYFGLRDYGSDGQYGLEDSPAAYVENMRAVFAEVRRALADDGTLWLNLGDTYSSKTKGSGGTAKVSLAGPATGSYFEPRKFNTDVPDKNLMGIPWRTAFALQDDGWILRNAITWAKPNAMPESVTDRLSSKHELIFLFSKSRRYWFDLDPIREPNVTADRPLVRPSGRGRAGSWSQQSGGNHQEPTSSGLGRGEAGRNPGDVWTIPTSPYPGAHFAVFPVEIPRRAIQSGCKPGGTVLDPFSGSGTTGLAAGQLGRRYVGIDLSREYLDLSLRTRLAQTSLIDGEAS